LMQKNWETLRTTTDEGQKQVLRNKISQLEDEAMPFLSGVTRTVPGRFEPGPVGWVQLDNDAQRQAQMVTDNRTSTGEIRNTTFLLDATPDDPSWESLSSRSRTSDPNLDRS
jgi:hypothetical protein